jgi:hypothetical protein
MVARRDKPSPAGEEGRKGPGGKIQKNDDSAAIEEHPSGGSGTCTVNVPEDPSEYYRRDPGFRLFGYI